MTLPPALSAQLLFYMFYNFRAQALIKLTHSLFTAGPKRFLDPPCREAILIFGSSPEARKFRLEFETWATNSEL